jgi:SAM-dependent methyltransferase
MNEHPAPSTPSAQAAPPAGLPDLDAIKQRQQATWASGDFAVIGTTLQIVGETLAEAADIRANERVLDVAAGNGNATLAAARRFASVTSTDYVPALLDKGRARAAAEGLTVAFQVADAENLPFPDASFDVVLSSFGAMFAPDHRRTADEMWRVVRDGQLDAGRLHRPPVQGDRRPCAAAAGAPIARALGH